MGYYKFGKFWEDATLWAAAAKKESQEIELSDFLGKEMTGWNMSTLQDYARETRKILDADLSFPIIMSDDGVVMDGEHRLVKALLNGDKTIKAVVLSAKELPPPDYDEHEANKRLNKTLQEK